MLVALGVVSLLVPIAAVGCRKTSVETRAWCDALTLSAETELQRAVIAANSASSCVADTDCVEAPAKLDCLGSCGGEAIPKAAAGGFSSTVRSIDQTTCKQWSGGSCATVSPRVALSCSARVARCTPSGCALFDARRLDPPGCAALMALAQGKQDEALAAADTACTHDADCMKVGRQACHDDYCGGAAIATRAKVAHEAAMKRIDDGPCKQWRDGECPSIDPSPSPSCVTIPVKCTNNRCVPIPP